MYGLLFILLVIGFLYYLILYVICYPIFVKHMLVSDIPVKSLQEDSKAFVRYLKGRAPPIEKDKFKEMKDKAYDEVVQRPRNNVEITTDKDLQTRKKSIQDQVRTLLHKKIYNWTPMQYNIYNSLIYLVGCSPAQYAVLVRIFAEINLRDPEFKPRSLFDFGSGIGTAMW